MVNVAVVGAGHWGPNLIRNFYNRHSSHVAWVVDQDPSRLREAKTRFPEIRTTTDLRDALRDDGVGAVIVATPTATHYSIVRAALESRKHVLVEKPLATNSSDAAALVQLAESLDLTLMVGHVFLYNPGVRKVRELLEAGEIGRVQYVSMVRTNLGPVRTDVDAAWDLAAQDVSIANYWLNSEAEAASAVGGSWLNEGIQDAVFATLQYPGNILVHIHVSWLNPRKARDITVVGDRRMVTLDDMNLPEPLRIYDKGILDDRASAGWVDTFAAFRASVREGDIVIPKVALGEPLRDECDHFLECLATRERPLTDGRQASAVVRALEAIERSLRAGGCQEPLR